MTKWINKLDNEAAQQTDDEPYCAASSQFLKYSALKKTKRGLKPRFLNLYLLNELLVADNAHLGYA